MSLISIPNEKGDIPTFVSKPKGDGPWPGVVIIHDALGMTEDLRNQARWLAQEGYMAVAPDLFHWGGRVSCLVKTMRDLVKGDKGRVFDDIASVKTWLEAQVDCTGKVGIVGFCYGGGFALALAPNHGYSAVAANYGAVADWGWPKLEGSCPIVASYGKEDPTLKGEAAKLEEALSEYKIPHDIKEYEGAGHGFMNQHDSEDSSWIFKILSWVSNTKYNESATMDARERIVNFFDVYLKNLGITGS
ncbi:MAG: dienelactone hydrolase family protein [Gammaproteobacteria bacterium]|nr:dienelactone hydrolase family protein [Gammaproteobacteria bacterium]